MWVSTLGHAQGFLLYNLKPLPSSFQLILAAPVETFEDSQELCGLRQLPHLSVPQAPHL